jgi:ATP/maltotriose-dependent transcriptional regulator MalT
VKSHLIHIYGKLGVDDRTSAVNTALEQGIIRLTG